MVEDKWTREAREEWRQLGFHSLCDDAAKGWRLTGSRSGLGRFAHLLCRYVANPTNAPLSEHEHHNPYGSLEIMTWGVAGFDGHAIHGTLQDLMRLAGLVETALISATPGSRVSIREEYSRKPNTPSYSTSRRMASTLPRRTSRFGRGATGKIGDRVNREHG